MENYNPVSVQEFIHQFKRLLEQDQWDHRHIEAAFRLLTEISVLKGKTRFNLEQALNVSTRILDTNAFREIQRLNKWNTTDPEAIFEQFAISASKQLIAQLNIMQEEMRSAILTQTHPDYEKYTSPYQYSQRPEFLYKYLQDEMDWNEVKRLEENLNKQLEEAGIGKYGMLLKMYLRDNNISQYRQMLENDSVKDFILKREGEFLVAFNSSIAKGMSEKHAERLNWDILIRV
nr:hypothetical protein [uncultured Sediminibacterium sp.]